MIVHRTTILVKRGCMQELIGLIKSFVAKNDPNPEKVRLSWAMMGPVNVLVSERAYENLAELEASVAEWMGKPDTAAFWEKYNTLTERGGSREIWSIVE